MGMKKNVLETKNEMVDGEINPWERNLISKNVLGNCREKMTSINPKIMNLSYHPLSNTKMGSQPWKDEGNAGKHEGKMSFLLQLREEVKRMGKEWNGHTFLGVLFPHKKKYDFPN